MTKGRIITTVGGMIRRDFRRQLNTLPGVTYTEDKGLLTSQFVITAPDLATYNTLRIWINALSGQH